MQRARRRLIVRAFWGFSPNGNMWRRSLPSSLAS